MAAEAPTIALLTPYKLGKFNLSHRYTNTPCKILSFLSLLFSMIWIVNMCDVFWFFFFFLGFFFFKNHVMVFFLVWLWLCKKKSCLWHIPVGIMNCFVYKGFNFQEIVVDYLYMSFSLCNTLALLSIFLSVHICVCFVFWPRNYTFFFQEFSILI